MTRQAASTELYSARELAHAARVPVRRIRELIASGRIRSIDGEFVMHQEAVRVARAGIGSVSVTYPTVRPGERPIFMPPPVVHRSKGLPFALSSTLHAAFAAAAVLLTTIGLSGTDQPAAAIDPLPTRMVFIALPGPGGGGGGGGVRQLQVPPKAERKGPKRAVSSPLPPRKDPEVATPLEKPVEHLPPPLEHEDLPQIVAPVATLPSDARDRAGVLADSQSEAESRGPGQGGGVGTGQGTGIGEGQGTGIGPGSGGGTGGGPYRPGSGIEPPRLIREVKADYTDEARRAGIRGEVLLEIVIRSDGSVGDTTVLRGLGYGLDRRAIDAVRQWRFAPAKRLGQPVDVLVEVAVEFSLR
jgi:TonB family protein